MDIVEFLSACLSEDEVEALATTPTPVPGRWRVSRDKHAPDNAPLYLVRGEDPYEPGYEGYSATQIIVFAADWQTEAEANLRHIARHDPARVLAEVAAKRAILAMHELYEQKNSADMVQRGVPEYYRYCDCQSEDGLIHGEWPCDTLKHLAAVYADHPDYNLAWGMEQ